MPATLMEMIVGANIAALKNLAYGFAHILDTASLCRHLQSFSLHRDEKT